MNWFGLLVFAALAVATPAAAQDSPTTAPTPTPLQASPEAHIARLLQRHLSSCWQMPTDLPQPERLIVVVEFTLDEQGALVGEPRVAEPRTYHRDRPMRIAVERAVRAVRTCSPYPLSTDPIASANYDSWREVRLTFALRP